MAESGARLADRNAALRLPWVHPIQVHAPMISAPLLRPFALAVLLAGLLHPVDSPASEPPLAISRVQHRPGALPVIAVVAQGEAVLSDFMVPYGVLAQSGAARVVAVNLTKGAIKAGPITVLADMTVAEFEREYPDGADYVVVPATADHHATELEWLRVQRDRGAALVSICDGVELLAEAGVLDGRRATGHWASLAERRKRFPRVSWQTNVRYVADGDVASSAGVSASLPISLSMVAALATPQAARDIANRLDAASWDPTHDSDIFRVGPEDIAVHKANMRVPRNDVVAVMVRDGDDEVALSLHAETWSRTMRNDVVLVSERGGAVRLRGGLRVQTAPADSVKADVSIALADAAPAGRAVAADLDVISRRYGAGTARLAALGIEYPWGDLADAR